MEHFAFYDVMGLELDSGGMCKEDIIYALKGHIANGYTFNPLALISNKDSYYISNPSLENSIHCLVSVIPADNVKLLHENVIDKMMSIRKEASRLGIPQVVFMTKVDQACPETRADLTKVYESWKIKSAMEECSNRLTVPINCIFPVKNYHKEIQLNEDINCLMLAALTQIVHWANDYIKKQTKSE
ncbi:interferon-induced protein 44-like [Hoplias malabaricus]|uniref:interferon-induced protein 44-like n=1 Tax=Hoplias malabaricus TaxID=27720 RepID=UPI0034630096